MGKAVTVYEAKTNLSRILDEVERGSEYVVTRNGVPCAKVIPIAKPGKVPLGFVRGAVTEAFFAPLPEGELAAWEGRAEPKPRGRRKVRR
jgi:prevent-host-death family protein